MNDREVAYGTAMSIATEWIEAIGTWVAPILIFGAGYILGDRRDRRSARMKVLIDASDHAQRFKYVCDQARQDNLQLAALRREIGNLRSGLDPEQLPVDIREKAGQLRMLNQRRAELAVAMNSVCMLADVTFGHQAAPLVAAVQTFARVSDANQEAEVNMAFNAVSAAIKALALATLGRTPAAPAPQA